jgi:hypothetical protein
MTVGRMHAVAPLFFLIEVHAIAANKQKSISQIRNDAISWQERSILYAKEDEALREKKGREEKEVFQYLFQRIMKSS